VILATPSALGVEERVMSKEQRRADYLAKAREAEEQAAKVKEQLSRDQWLKIAESYRELARHT
jgi:uncharacterized alpha-E superfamily protein